MSGNALLEHSNPAGSSENSILVAEDITKVFPGTVALDAVTFEVERGTVNVLVGENGAGKSTLMKILGGVELPTSGRIRLEGEEVQLLSPLDASERGIAIIHQELNLCPNLSVAENIFLGREKVSGLFVDLEEQREQSRRLIQRLEHEIDVDALVGDLRIGQQQIVEIAKALAQDIRILIMDEPTSALSASEVEVLFRIVRDLKESGVSIIYISHKLEEILEIGDTITVLRDGHIVARALVADVDVPWIVENMVGRKPAALFSRTAHEMGHTMLRVKDLTLPRVEGGYVVDHVSFQLRAGEILGFYGLMGAGRSELLECLIGNQPESTGTIYVDDEVSEGVTVAGRIEAGFALVPEDRQRDGLVQTLSVADNVLLASLSRYLRGLFLVRKDERRAVRRLIDDLSIRVANPNQSITSLSGGNQQKVVVAKALLTEPKVLLLDEPTRGVDVGAKAEIFQTISRLAEQGYGVIFVASEVKEILAMCDRVIVMSRGRVTGEFTRDAATEDALIAASGVGHGPSRSREVDGHDERL